MKKHNLLLIWATVSYIAMVVGAPWYFLYEITALRCLAIFGIFSSFICATVVALKADKQALKSFLKDDTPFVDLLIHLLKRTKDLFLRSVEKGEVSIILTKICAILMVLVTIPAIIIVVSVITLSATIFVFVLVAIAIIIAVLCNFKFKD